MYRIALTLSVLALAACQPSVPNSGESYGDYMARRDGGSYGSVIAGPAVTSQPIGATSSGARPRADTFAGIASVNGEAVHYTPGGVSDEQNFDAVSQRETIQSDAERLRRQREQYVVVQPTALPQRTSSGPNIVQYALQTSHNPGTQMFSRSSFLRFKTLDMACGAFTSADLAQEEFLRQGGPERDKLGVDPDGDGFACGWDPRPFRNALR